MLSKLIKAISLASLVFISACASTLISPIKEDDRAIGGEFDGVWKLTQKALSARQTVGTRLFNCKFYNSTAIVLVKNGIGQLQYGKHRGEGNISKKGAFYIEIPTEHKFKNSLGDNDPKNGVTYVFKGFLAKDASKGLFTIGMQAQNNTGCSTKLTITPAV